LAIAIFDLDNTLIAGDSDHAWGQFLVSKNIVDAVWYQQENNRFLKDYQTGELDIKAYLEFALKPLADNALNNLLKWRQEFLDSVIQPLFLTKAFDLIETHRQKGDFLLIVTATNRFVTELIAEALGVDDLIASEPEWNQTGFTGKISGTPSFKEGKITRLDQWLTGKKYSLEGAFFYSDSHNDLPLLERVDNPVAVDPDDILRTHCENVKWPIISLR